MSGWDREAPLQSSDEQGARSALFVLPSMPGASETLEAAWIAGANFAQAIGAQLGSVDVLTPRGLLEPEEIRRRSVHPGERISATRTVARFLPQTARVIVGDARDWRRARDLRKMASATSGPYDLVVQYHGRFQSAGHFAASRLRVPLVARVEALEVREEDGWGVRRPLYGGLLERFGELPHLRRADLLAPVSGSVLEELQDAGIDERRCVVIPNGVDLELFSPGLPDPEIRKSFELERRFTVGWVGGFRPFHGLDQIPAIVHSLRERDPEVAVCLVGTGPYRNELAARLKGLERWVRLVGAVPYRDIPRWLRTVDVCLLLAGSDRFHYSPLKLYEYLGCGRPVVAARAGEIADVIQHGRNGLLFEPGDPAGAVRQLLTLRQDESLRRQLASQARTTAVRIASWNSRAGTLVNALRARGHLLEAVPANAGMASGSSSV